MRTVSTPPFDFDVCGFGSLNVDYIVPGPTGDRYFDELSEGEERAASDRALHADRIKALPSPKPQIGGSAVNVIRALRTLDPQLRLSLVAPLGRLPEGLSLSALDGIDIDGLVSYDGDANTSVSVVENADRRLRTYNDPAGVRQLLECERDRTISMLCRARVIHVTSLLGPDAGRMVGEILESVRSNTGDQVRISVDLGLLWAEDHVTAKAILRHAQTIFVSEEELRALVPGVPSPLSSADERSAVGELLMRYDCEPKAIAVLKRRAQPDGTDQDRDPRPRVGGAIYRASLAGGEPSRDEAMRDGLDQGQIVDSTGAGDFFAAGVLAEMVSRSARAVLSLRLGTAMARHKFGRTGDSAFERLDRLLYGGAVGSEAGQVFVSHSHEDAVIAGALLDCLVAAGADRQRDIFCTSQPDTAVPFGQALDPEVLAHLRSASLMLFVATSASVASSACQRELGAAQVLRIPTVPLRHPEFPGWKNLDLPINFHRGATLDQPQELGGVIGMLTKRFGWKPQPTAARTQAMSGLGAALRSVREGLDG